MVRLSSKTGLRGMEIPIFRFRCAVGEKLRSRAWCLVVLTCMRRLCQAAAPTFPSFRSSRVSYFFLIFNPLDAVPVLSSLTSIAELNSRREHHRGREHVATDANIPRCSGTHSTGLRGAGRPHFPRRVARLRGDNHLRCAQGVRNH